MSDKWINFEEEIAFQICNSIAEIVSAEYWLEWKRIILEGNKNEQFLRGLNKVEKI